jgi:hypothetical protein
MNTRQQPSALKAAVGRDDHRVTDNAAKLRMLAAAAVLVSAAIHLYLWFDVFRHTDVVGPAFLLNAIGGTTIAVLLVTWRHWIPLLLAIGFGASTLGAFVIAATVGLFGVHEHWTGWDVWTAAVSEVVAIVAAGTALLQENRNRSGNQAD